MVSLRPDTLKGIGGATSGSFATIWFTQKRRASRNRRLQAEVNLSLVQVNERKGVALLFPMRRSRLIDQPCFAEMEEALGLQAERQKSELP